MKSIRVVSLVVVGVMLAVIIYGFSAGGFGEDASALWALPWGKVSLVDLYAGLLIIGVWIAYRERQAVRIVVWSLALVVLGNLAAGVYLAVAAWRSADMAGLLLGDNNNR